MATRDEVISSRVHQALSADRRLSGLPISVRVSDGDIFLKGTVDCEDEINVARFILMGIPGVRHVNVDELRIKGQPHE